ncbi:hypothetical protein X743_17760 [Mesorhizobium sp. LNHC252B00]|uniref:PfkB family carbohydrate kinase n=1 Tax=Mesorhizobium sp. LNHC252B00 TaxID=1287252 RepID=UPI0003CE1821|nr:PfkB family carbohydrate kinase [Mesorhizobium sp. LNHC252B00]ESY72296.1 hypothetical protein X743_17760 [Mesorhizobium sp. LNHC252B00]
MAQPAVLSLGSINADLRFEVDKPFSSDATVRASGFSRKSGGKAANVAYFTQRLGFPTKLLGQVGDDDLATVAIGPFMQENLDLEAVFVAPNSMTGIAVVVVPADGNKSILSVANANMNWQTPAVEKVVQAIDNAPASSVLIADFEVPRIVLEAAFKAAERRGFRIIVDPTFADQIEKTDLKRFYAVSPNQKEAADVLGIEVANESQASQAATEFNALGAKLHALSSPTVAASFVRGMRRPQYERPLSMSWTRRGPAMPLLPRSLPRPWRTNRHMKPPAGALRLQPSRLVGRARRRLIPLGRSSIRCSLLY